MSSERWPEGGGRIAADRDRGIRGDNAEQSKRRHVGGVAGDLPVAGTRARLVEVDEPGLTFPVDHHVLGGQVLVRDPGPVQGSDLTGERSASSASSSGSGAGWPRS